MVHQHYSFIASEFEGCFYEETAARLSRTAQKSIEKEGEIMEK